MIKSERLELLIEILTSQMNHWIFFPVALTALGMALFIGGNTNIGAPDVLMWALCGLFPIAFFLVRYYVGRFFPFLLCHVAIAALSLILPVSYGLTDRVICVLCGAAYMIYSMTLRLKEDAEIASSAIHPIAAVGIAAAANFLLHRQEGTPQWDSYYFLALIGVSACYLIAYYLKRYLNFLQVNRSSAGYLPAREILQSGMGFVLPYTLIGALILILSLNVAWLEPILNALKAGLKAVLRFILGLFSWENTPEPLMQSPDAGYMEEAGLLEMPSAEPFWLWKVLEPLIYVLFFGLCAFGIVKFITWAVKLIQDRFGKTLAGNDFSFMEESVYDIREKCGVVQRDSEDKREGLFHRFTPLERIRRLYKKQVLAGGIEGDNRETLNYMTARECGSKLSLPDMARLYEQARYSGIEVTSEDVKRMKLACGGKAPLHDT